MPDAGKKATCISCVSGKGGVGKTMIAANLAWITSRADRTLLIDLDFHNQGSSGLFAPHFPFGERDAFSSITSQSDLNLSQFTKVDNNFYMLPAISWRDRPDTQKVLMEVHSENFQHRLQVLLSKLASELGIEIVVLDCHGGVDPVSFSAYQCSDVTLVVTEADSVTFAGTLELLNYYEEQVEQTVSVRPSGGVDQANTNTETPDCTPHTNIKFIVNRLPSKYKFTDLELLYRPYFAELLRGRSRDESVFCYIPSEELLADGFGGYPFHVPLAPTSIFSRKMAYISYDLLGEKLDFRSVAAVRPLIRSRRKRDKVKKIVISNEKRNVNAVMNFFAWSSVTFIIYMSVAVVFLISAKYIESLRLAAGEILNDSDLLIFIIFLIMATLSPVVWYFFKAMVGIMLYFRSRHLYNRRLFAVLKNKSTAVWQYLTLFRSFALRWGTTIGVWFFFLYFIFFISTFFAVTIGVFT